MSLATILRARPRAPKTALDSFGGIMRKAELVKRCAGSSACHAEDAVWVIECLGSAADVHPAHGHSFLDTIQKARPDHMFGGHRGTGTFAGIALRASHWRLPESWKAICAEDKRAARQVTPRDLVHIAASGGLT